MPFELCLIRHGAAAAAWSESLDPSLSDEGRAQAQAVAKLFARQTPCTIVSSPLARAEETAQPLADRWKTSVEIDERVREIPCGWPMARRREWLTAVMAARWPELDASVQLWRTRALQSVLRYGSDTLVFTHFMVINALVAHATQDARVVCFEPDYGSVTRFRCDGDRLTLVSLGEARTTLVNL
ncbi:MAG: histidine phosphatase family protein [Gammaproteobacteria bacterium]